MIMVTPELKLQSELRRSDEDAEVLTWLSLMVRPKRLKSPDIATAVEVKTVARILGSYLAVRVLLTLTCLVATDLLLVCSS